MKFVMSDARVFTSYEPSCSFNLNLQKKYMPNGNHNDFRYYLQQNAEKIIADLSKTNESSKICPVCQKSLDYKP